MSAPLPGLSVTDAAAYERTLRSDACEVRHQILQTNLSHGGGHSIDHLFLDGQINIVGGNTDGITRTLQISFDDPTRSLAFDGNTPADGVGGLSRLLWVRTYVFVPDLDRWVGGSAGVFRPSKPSRDGDTITIEADGKEVLSLVKAPPYTLAAKQNTVGAIEKILRRQGETRFRFPKGTRATLAKAVPVGGPDEKRMPWKVAWRLARAIGYQLYYDLDGFAAMRVQPAAPSWEFYEYGDSADVLSRPKTTTDLTTIRNRVVVTGKTKPHGKTKAKSIVVPRAAHPANQFSAQELAVNGEEWYNTEFFDRPELHTRADVTKFADARLGELVTESTDVEVTVLPYWHGLPMDYLRLHGQRGTVNFRLRDASIPLGPSTTGMTIGYQQRVRGPKAGRLRR